MGFPERAVNAFVKGMEAGVVSEGQIRCVLRCSQPVLSRIFYDTDQMETLCKFLDSPDEMVRRSASRVLSHINEMSPLINAALNEKESGLLVEMLQMIGKQTDGVEELSKMLLSEDTIVRDEAIEMFRRTGKVENLFMLVFTKDDCMTQRIKRYFNEREQVANI